MLIITHSIVLISLAKSLYVVLHMCTDADRCAHSNICCHSFISPSLQWLHKQLGHLHAGGKFERKQNHWNENCTELVRKTLVHCKALQQHHHGNGEESVKCWESESQGYSIYSCFNNTTPLWKEYYIPCKYDENTYQIFPASVLLKWTQRTCHQG